MFKQGRYLLFVSYSYNWLTEHEYQNTVYSLYTTSWIKFKLTIFMKKVVYYVYILDFYVYDSAILVNDHINIYRND